MQVSQVSGRPPTLFKSRGSSFFSPSLCSTFVDSNPPSLPRLTPTFFPSHLCLPPELGDPPSTVKSRRDHHHHSRLTVLFVISVPPFLPFLPSPHYSNLVLRWNQLWHWSSATFLFLPAPFYHCSSSTPAFPSA